jgi:DMSO/TMAO reductase YedYZ molybdopterin-dependent catalytic subunit
LVQGTRSDSIRADFIRGAGGGFVALVFGFLLRLGGLAPFPPEAAIESFISIVPASVEEPAVQQLGDFAGLLGLLVATVITVAVYGVLGILFERYFGRRGRLGSLSRLERALLYSILPWLIFSFVLFPVTGYSIFGQSSAFGSPDTIWIFPLTLLLSQLLFGSVLSGDFDRRNNLPLLGSNVRETGRPAGVPSSPSRRAFIEKGVILASAVVLGLTSAGRMLSSLAQQGLPVPSGSGAVDLQDAPDVFRDARLQTLANSEVTSNGSFYRVAIDLFDPSVPASTWSLLLSGAVLNPKKYGLAELQALPSVDEYNTFECVSNVVNGNLIGNAKWTGVRISDLFADAGGSLPSAKYAVFYSVDGYSVGIPISKAMMQESILAYRMNDTALPVKHGYPLRAVIPGLYGMMSAKWINEIKLVDSVYMGYWQNRGWTNEASVRTEALIMVPEDQSSASLSKNNGSVLLGGVAYAGDRGISNVEVSVDGGQTWKAAELKKALSKLTWVLWAYDWHPGSTGAHDVYARATDGAGQVQTSVVTDTFPNGATGYAMIRVNVVN